MKAPLPTTAPPLAPAATAADAAGNAFGNPLPVNPMPADGPAAVEAGVADCWPPAAAADVGSAYAAVDGWVEEDKFG